MKGVELFYPQLSKQQIQYMFPNACPVKKILRNSQLADDRARIKLLEEFLRTQCLQTSERQDFFERLFTCTQKEGFSNEILEYFSNRYEVEYGVFLQEVDSLVILELDYLTDDEKVKYWKEQGMTRRDFHVLWQTAIQDHDDNLASLLLQDPELFTFQGANKCFRNLLQMYFQVHGLSRATRKFVHVLVKSPLITPRPALEWCQMMQDKKCFELIQQNPLFSQA